MVCGVSGIRWRGAECGEGKGGGKCMAGRGFVAGDHASSAAGTQVGRKGDRRCSGQGK